MTGAATASLTRSRRRGGRGWRHAATLFMAAVVLLMARQTWSAPMLSGQVVLLTPPSSATVARRAMTRIREELVAGGFDVSNVDPGPRRDPVSLAAVMERQEEAIAVIALVGDLEQPGAELWILDRVGPSPEVRRIAVPALGRDQLTEVLAIRTIEVLKASALKLLLDARHAAKATAKTSDKVAAKPDANAAETSAPGPPAAPSEAPAPSAADAPPEPAPPAAPVPAITAPAKVADGAPSMLLFGLEMGLSVLDSRGGPGAAALPVVRARARLYKPLFTRLTLAGLGTQPRVEGRSGASVIGSSSVAQSVGLLELVLAIRLASRWHAALSAGAGALYLRSDGEGFSPYQGLHQVKVVAAMDAGAGLLADLSHQFSLAFEVHGLVAAPHPTLRFDDTETATIGYPAVLASLTMVAWL